ncbi:MAG: RNA-directed DNA polymerase [Bryobacterales bacterium]|nr:RNA-directed DNA polymerase [Bryobacterales bacterium]
MTGRIAAAMNAAFLAALARSLMAGEQTVEAARARAMRTLGRRWRWAGPFAARYIAAFRHGPRPRLKDVIAFIRADEGFDLAALTYGSKLSIAHWLAAPQRMLPYGPAADWDLPSIHTEGDLARWLALHATELDWLADRKNLCRKQANPKLRHYRYVIEPKRRGGIRLIESPKRLLKELQRRILAEILDRIPPHPAAHGFVKGRSIVTFATPHTNQPLVMRLDLENFFPSFPAARVQALYRTLGYPDAVADVLTGLCTTSTLHDIVRAQTFEDRRLYEQRHLPQGAPTSPALANAMAYRLDCRLSGLARTAGAVYTRYADDLAFSGGDEFRRNAHRFQHHAAAIALEEGFAVNFRKTRIMRQGVRQSLAGLVVNGGLSIRRRDLETLEAILTNCLRHGPTSQNRANHGDFRAHLEGRISYVEMVHPEKGRRLRSLFDRIDSWANTL